MTGGVAVILGGTGRNLGAGMSGGVAYIHKLRRDAVNRDSLANGELELLPLDRADVELLRSYLQLHVEKTDSALAKRLLDDMDATVAAFVKVLPRDYAAVIQTRQTAIDEGLDPDGDVVWGRILEVTGG
jgi:glutamate synthase (NADPH/NADH) large chain